MQNMLYTIYTISDTISSGRKALSTIFENVPKKMKD